MQPGEKVKNYRSVKIGQLTVGPGAVFAVGELRTEDDGSGSRSISVSLFAFTVYRIVPKFALAFALTSVSFGSGAVYHGFRGELRLLNRGLLRPNPRLVLRLAVEKARFLFRCLVHGGHLSVLALSVLRFTGDRCLRSSDVLLCLRVELELFISGSQDSGSRVLSVIRHRW